MENPTFFGRVKDKENSLAVRRNEEVIGFIYHKRPFGPISKSKSVGVSIVISVTDQYLYKLSTIKVKIRQKLYLGHSKAKFHINLPALKFDSREDFMLYTFQKNETI